MSPYCYKLTVALVLGLICLPCPSQAHHVASHQASVNLAGNYNPIVQGTGLPQKRLAYTFDWNHLDNGAGDVFVNQISGEYNLLKDLSLTVRIPLIGLQMNFRDDHFGLGDIAIGGKLALLQEDKNFIFIGTDISLPSGNQSKGTGAGAVVGTLYSSFIHKREKISFFASLIPSIAFDSNPEPSLVTSGGIIVPVLKNKVPIDFFISLRSQLLFHDDTFAQGSYKIFLNPGIVIYPEANKKLSITLATMISMIDRLKVKSHVVLQNNSLALTQDVQTGMSLDINYSF